MTGQVRQKSTKSSARSQIGQVSSKGFTIIELMVVLVIIGILSGLAIPKFLRANAEAVLEGEAQRLLLSFRLAKQAANKTGFRHFMRITPASGKIEVWRAKTATDSAFNTTNDTLIFKDSLDPRVRFGFASSNPKPANAPDEFDFSGKPASTTDGLGTSNINANENCLDGQAYPATGGKATEGWATSAGATGDYLVSFCGGAIADMSIGIAYLSTARSNYKYYALGYTSNSIQVRLWAWNGSNAWDPK
jgi:prepilin-type N-terminal cleavage/methylation domain-containing protein